MNRRKLLLTTAKSALLTAFGVVTRAKAQTPIESRTVLPIPQANPKSTPALLPNFGPSAVRFFPPLSRWRAGSANVV